MSDSGRGQRGPTQGQKIAVWGGLGLVLVLLAVLGVSVLIGGPAPGLPDQSPDATFGFDVDVTNSSVTVSHDSGQAFTAENTDRLVVLVDDRHEGAFELPAEEGDQVAVGNVSPGSIVRVLWVGPEGANETVAHKRIVETPTTNESG